ncbi:cation diffusion facilitator family transporter [Kaarinaea lacus]
MNGSQTERTTRLLKLATMASVVTATVLIVAKVVAWLMTGSVSVLASLVDSLMDAVASLINFFAVRFSLQPPDKEHRFGHGKAESLAGLAQATFVAGSAAFLLLEALDRLVHPRELEQITVGISVMGFSIVVTLILLAIQRYVIRHTGSVAIRADALHYATDLLTGASVITALLMAHFLEWTSADSWFAIGIAVYILYSAWQIGYDATQSLIDRELPDSDREKIKALALGHPGVFGIHDLRTRQSGLVRFIQLHLELDKSLPLEQTHEVADEVEALICKEFPNSDVIIHQDPVKVASGVGNRQVPDD